MLNKAKGQGYHLVFVVKGTEVERAEAWNKKDKQGCTIGRQKGTEGGLE